MAFYWNTHRTHVPKHPEADARIFRILRKRMKYEVRKFLTIFIVVVLKLQMVFGFLYETKLTLQIKRKPLKDILK
jgi:hypothetical protein